MLAQMKKAKTRRPWKPERMGTHLQTNVSANGVHFALGCVKTEEVPMGSTRYTPVNLLSLICRVVCLFDSQKTDLLEGRPRP